MFPRHYKNFVFCAVGLVDSGQFKGAADVHALETKVREDLEKYVNLAQRMGFYAEYRYTLGTDGDVVPQSRGLIGRDTRPTDAVAEQSRHRQRAVANHFRLNPKPRAARQQPVQRITLQEFGRDPR